MASAWGSSWGSSWGDSWGVVAAAKKAIKSLGVVLRAAAARVGLDVVVSPNVQLTAHKAGGAVAQGDLSVRVSAASAKVTVEAP